MAPEAPALETSEEAPEAPDSFDEILKRVVQPAAAAPVLDAGSELVGRFQITRVLGAGGMGTVYVARDTTLGREVARAGTDRRAPGRRGAAAAPRRPQGLRRPRHGRASTRSTTCSRSSRGDRATRHPG